jgi:hypothetical protein
VCSILIGWFLGMINNFKMYITYYIVIVRMVMHRLQLSTANLSVNKSMNESATTCNVDNSDISESLFDSGKSIVGCLHAPPFSAKTLRLRFVDMLNIFATRFNRLSKAYYGLPMQIKLMRKTKEIVGRGRTFCIVDFKMRHNYAVSAVRKGSLRAAIRTG